MFVENAHLPNNQLLAIREVDKCLNNIIIDISIPEMAGAHTVCYNRMYVRDVQNTA